MFAIVKTGGKQYKVSVGDVLKIERIEASAGKKVILDEVLMLVDGNTVEVGAPLVKGAAVEAELVAQDRAEKVVIFKKKRRQNYRRKKGHTQDVTVLRVVNIKR